MKPALSVNKNHIYYKRKRLLSQEVEYQMITDTYFWFKTNGPFL